MGVIGSMKYTLYYKLMLSNETFTIKIDIDVETQL